MPKPKACLPVEAAEEQSVSLLQVISPSADPYCLVPVAGLDCRRGLARPGEAAVRV